jgi:hypothetical protein
MTIPNVNLTLATSPASIAKHDVRVNVPDPATADGTCRSTSVQANLPTMLIVA